MNVPRVERVLISRPRRVTEDPQAEEATKILIGFVIAVGILLLAAFALAKMGWLPGDVRDYDAQQQAGEAE